MLIDPLENALADASHFQPSACRPDGLCRLGDEIAELSAHLDAAAARLLDLIRRFDAEGGWEGFRSCAHPLARNG